MTAEEQKGGTSEGQRAEGRSREDGRTSGGDAGSEAIRDRFAAVETHEALVRLSRAYCERAVRERGVDADLDLVDWEVSTRAKRRAAAVKRPRVREAEIGRPIDWEAYAAEQSSTRSGSDGGGAPDTDPPIERCTMSLTWAAFREFSPAEWTSTLRHELIHVEQFQAYGTTDHGPAFKRRAAELDTEVRCRAFGTPKYRLLCGECGEKVAHRYRDCKLVRNHRDYVSRCCGAPLACERPAESSATTE